MTNKFPPVKVLVTKRVYGSSYTEYQAFCERCLETVASPGLRGGRYAWETKAPAVKAAKYHISHHPVLEDRLERIVNGNGEYGVVMAELTAEDVAR